MKAQQFAWVHGRDEYECVRCTLPIPVGWLHLHAVLVPVGAFGFEAQQAGRFEYRQHVACFAEMQADHVVRLDDGEIERRAVLPVPDTETHNNAARVALVGLFGPGVAMGHRGWRPPPNLNGDTPAFRAWVDDMTEVLGG